MTTMDSKKSIKHNNLRIGEMAELNDVSEQTLRIYDRIGLLKPYKKDDVTGYRYYDIQQCATLDVIKYLKESNLSLKEIKKIMDQDNPDIDYIIKALQHRYKEIENKINELGIKKIAIEQTIDSVQSYQNIPKAGTILVEYHQKRYAFLYTGNDNYYQNPPLYEQGLIEMKKEMGKYGIPYFCSNNPGSVTRMKNLDNEHLYCNELFIYIDKHYTKGNVPVLEIPGGTYLCIYADDIQNEESFVHKLVQYAREHNMEIIGDCYEESISDIITIKSNRNHLMMRIKFPIKFNPHQ